MKWVLVIFATTVAKVSFSQHDCKYLEILNLFPYSNSGCQTLLFELGLRSASNFAASTDTAMMKLMRSRDEAEEKEIEDEENEELKEKNERKRNDRNLFFLQALFHTECCLESVPQAIFQIYIISQLDPTDLSRLHTSNFVITILFFKWH